MPFFEGIDASTVVLAIHAIFSGQFCGAFVTVFFLEIIGEPVYTIGLCQLLADLIEFFRIFQRTDGQGCGKVVAALFLSPPSGRCSMPLAQS